MKEYFKKIFHRSFLVCIYGEKVERIEIGQGFFYAYRYARQHTYDTDCFDIILIGGRKDRMLIGMERGIKKRPPVE